MPRLPELPTPYAVGFCYFDQRCHAAFCLSSHCFCLESQMDLGFLGGSLRGLSSCCRFLGGSRWLPVQSHDCPETPGDS